MSAIAADVWILTETHPAVAPEFGHVPVATSSAAPDRPEGECWVAIWVRPGLDAVPLPLLGEPERSAAARIEWSGNRSIIVVGTVLPWRQDGRRSPIRGGAAFCDALESQAGDWRRLRREHPSAELCVAGDFNLEVGHRLLAGTSVGRAAFADALARHDLSCATGGADDPRARRGWGGSIDHLLVSSGLRARSGDGIGIWPLEHPLPSIWPDHYGVRVDLDMS